MATNTNTTHTPGTVKGTARVTTTQLVPGMIIRFPGNKRAGRLARTAMIITVRSELRSNGNYSKRARWYIVELTDGTTSEFAPASRHDVKADESGAPIVHQVEGLIASREAEKYAAATDAFRAQMERYGRTADEHGLGHVLDACRENVTDEMGPEPTDGATVESARWWAALTASVWSEIDGEHGIDLDNPPPAPHVAAVLDEIHAAQEPEQGRPVAATESGPVLQLRLVEYPGTLF